MPLFSGAQWTNLELPSTSMNRFDDVYFIEAEKGWAVSGETGSIFHTESGDTLWNLQFQDTTKYLRSIEFANASLGFCGSLDSALYRTTNGGLDWEEITDSIQPAPAGVCGLAIPSDTVIYGCGKWTGPAFVIKSTDGGESWTYIDLSAYASTLVDLYFFNEQEGYVSGKANPASDGGIILHTTDGGDNWNVHYTTDFPEDVIWKLQSPDQKHFFGSIESQPVANNIRYIHSADSGQSWNIDTVQNGYHYIQSIGFLDSLHGWVGGLLILLETRDGGLTWDTASFPGFNYNRFFRLNDSIAYLAGNNVYRYNQQDLTTGKPPEKIESIHRLQAYPNPTAGQVQIDVSFRHHTFGQLELFSDDGKHLETLHHDHVEKGTLHFTADLQKFEGKLFFVILKTNEEMLFQKVVKK